LQKRGGKLLYDPELLVYRRPRGTFKAFCKMLLNYGRGRAEQVRLHPTWRSFPNFAPPLFCLYLVSLLLLPVLPRYCLWALAGLAVYGAALFLQAIVVLPLKKIHWLPWIMGLIFVSHVFYGLGFWRGCLTKPKPPPPEIGAAVRLERV